MSRFHVTCDASLSSWSAAGSSIEIVVWHDQLRILLLLNRNLVAAHAACTSWNRGSMGKGQGARAWGKGKDTGEGKQACGKEKDGGGISGAKGEGQRKGVRGKG